ncbi:ASCH domain-containing protein [Aeromonas dhakensis]|uniref:N(4)-acetylcytidine aminohydrolase n=1 Tax=Aeromonas dhakensis TaxID=196024 RepID=UPI000F88F842|nr:N(4)-acetylcytidine aminohydrolase [Aeromonas dhakensis]EIM1707612.1 ASCH domain-containing protein [Aeromonas dhakensis]RUQ10969.1 ASCH domain-containing protein [Aeromonas dhakensis]
MPTHPEFTFFSRFVADIQAGRKTITIRDESEANWQPGQRLALFTNPEHQPFGTIEVLSVKAVAFDELNDAHARQENMTLPELKQVIRDIYPTLSPLYVIEFKLLD